MLPEFVHSQYFCSYPISNTLTYQKYSYRPKFPFTFSYIDLLIKESTHLMRFQQSDS